MAQKPFPLNFQLGLKIKARRHFPSLALNHLILRHFIDLPGSLPGDGGTRGTRTRFTFRQSEGSPPVWSPDVSQIIFAAGGSSRDTIYERPASGAGDERELFTKPGEIKIPTSWSRDRRFLLYHTALVPKTGSDLWILPLEGDRKPRLLLGTDFNESYGSFSPDGRWIAYISNESGRNEIYVRPFNASGSEGPSFGEGRWQVSRDGVAAATPKWRNDGKEIFFPSPTGSSPMSVPVSTGGTAFQAGVPRQLFTSPPNQGWDVTPDGNHFLMLASPVQQDIQTPITVVLNWQGDLKK